MVHDGLLAIHEKSGLIGTCLLNKVTRVGYHRLSLVQANCEHYTLLAQA